MAEEKGLSVNIQQFEECRQKAVVSSMGFESVEVKEFRGCKRQFLRCMLFAHFKNS